jgi:ABC-type branched-subunit amino acid transport system substrate-binding protein
MKNKKLIALLTTTLMLLALVAGCAANDTEQQPAPSDVADEAPVVRIGSFLPLSGPFANPALHNRIGMEVYIEHFMEQGGFTHPNLAGATVELTTLDHEGVAETGINIFHRFVHELDKLAVIGGYNSAVSLAVGTIANRDGMVFKLTGTASDNGLTMPGNFVFRTTPGDQVELYRQTEMMHFLQERWDFQTVAIVAAQIEFGYQVSALYSAIAPLAGYEVIMEEFVPIGASDLSGSINRIRALNPDLIIAGLGGAEAILFQRQLAELNVNIPVFAKGWGYLDATFLPAAADVSEYVVATAWWLHGTLDFLCEEAHYWSDRMEAVLGEPITEMTVNGWQSMAVLLDAIDRAGVVDDRQAVSDAMMATDLDMYHPANLFNRYSRIYYEDGFSDIVDAMIYNQNWYASLQLGQIIDGRWHVIFPPEVVPDEINPVIWPIPGVIN